MASACEICGVVADGTPDDRAIDWLLERAEPSIRYLTRRDLLGEHPQYEVEEILADRFVAALLQGQRGDGGFGVHPYRKWAGGFWRMVSLAELAAPGLHPRLQAAVDHVLNWLTGPTRRTRGRVIDGLTRHCATQDGLGLAAACRLGYATAHAPSTRPMVGALAVAGRRLELRRPRQRPSLLVS
jgi:hypothetical protein